MSNNIVKTLLQQTYRFEPPQYTDDGAPIKTDPNRTPFLGQGYYFWDNNIERARDWGRKRCGGHYHILQGYHELSGSFFLDLAGSREDIIVFFTIYNKLCEKRGKKLKVCEFFTIALEMEAQTPGAFPFRIIRALEIRSKDKTIDYRTDTASSFLLNPTFIVCFYDKNDIRMQDLQIIHD